MKIDIKYRTTRGCGYGDREVTQSLASFVDESSRGLGDLVDLLVRRGAIDSDDAYELFKSSGDYELIQVFGGDE